MAKRVSKKQVMIHQALELQYYHRAVSKFLFDAYMAGTINWGRYFLTNIHDDWHWKQLSKISLSGRMNIDNNIKVFTIYLHLKGIQETLGKAYEMAVELGFDFNELLAGPSYKEHVDQIMADMNKRMELRQLADDDMLTEEERQWMIDQGEEV